jgi:hypothetical protein
MILLSLLIARFVENLSMFFSGGRVAEKKLHVLLPLSDKAHVPSSDYGHNNWKMRYKNGHYSTSSERTCGIVAARTRFSPET